MGQITFFRTFSQLNKFEEFSRFVSTWADQISTIVNGQLEFISNIRAAGLYNVTFQSATDVQIVNHSLGIVPRGTLTVKQTAAITIYAPPTAQYNWTNTQIFLQASGAGTVSLYVI